MRLLSTALVLMLLASNGAVACSYPEPQTFARALSSASSVFVFRVEEIQLKRKDFPSGAYQEWAEATIRVVESLKGKPSLAHVVQFSSDFCGGLHLDIGHYFIAATPENSARVVLRPADQSVLDITDLYVEHNVEATNNAGFLPVIRQALRGSPLPARFPTSDVLGRTRQTPAPPPSDR